MLVLIIHFLLDLQNFKNNVLLNLLLPSLLNKPEKQHSTIDLTIPFCLCLVVASLFCGSLFVCLCVRACVLVCVCVCVCVYVCVCVCVCV